MPLTLEELPRFSMADYLADPFRVLERLRPSPVAVHERTVDVISFELVQSSLMDGQLASFGAHNFAAEGATPLIASFIRNGVTPYMPPDAHRRVRKVFSRAFTIRQIGGAHDLIRAVADRVVREAVADADGRLEFVDTIASRFPIEVICRVVGIPHDEVLQFGEALSNLRYVVHIPVSDHVAELESALTILYKYTSELLDARRVSPRDDFLSALIAAEGIEGKLDPEELVWGVINLMLAGTDTTKYQFTSVMHDLAAQGVWRRVSEDLSLVPKAVSEVMRMRPMPQTLRRIAPEEIVLGGALIPEGTEVDLNLLAAGRDPAAYPDHGTFDLDRPAPIFPIIFGGGVHHCIGHALATAELNIGLEVLTAWIKDPEVVAAVPKPWEGVFGGFDSVEIAFTPA